MTNSRQAAILLPGSCFLEFRFTRGLRTTLELRLDPFMPFAIGPRRLGFGTEVGIPPRPREFDLSLAFPQSLKAHAVAASNTRRTGYSFLVMRARALGRRQRTAAGKTELVGPGFQSGTYGYAVIENETFTAPEIVLWRGCLEIAKNASIELADVTEAVFQDKAGRLLASDSPGTEHRDTLSFETVPVGLPPSGKLAEALDARIDRSRKCPDLHLVAVPRVDNDHAVVFDDLVPVARRNPPSRRRERLHVRPPHRHDFSLEPDLHPPKRIFFRKALPVPDPRTSRQGTNGQKDPIDRVAAARYCSVDSLFGNQHGSPGPCFCR